MMDKLYIKTVASVVIPYDKKFVYVKTAKDGKWGLPAGKLDLFEEVGIGLTREVREETNLTVVLENFLGVWDFKSDRESAVSNRVFSGRIYEGEMKINKPDEILELRTFALSELRELFADGVMRSGRANLEPVEEFLRGTKYPLSFIHTLF